jgi:predicted DNA-binding transcriptional regulator AlpA
VQNPNHVELDGLLRLRQVLALIPISRAAWYAGVKERRYPQPVRLSARVVAWKVSDIQAFIKGVSEK